MKQENTSASSNELRPAAIWATAHWPLLLFLTGVIHVKLYVKVAAIALYFVYFLYKKYPLRRPLTGITAFYLLMPLAGIVGALLHGSFNDSNYKFAFLFGTGTWLLAAAASRLVYLSAKQIEYERMVATLKVFFGVNLVISIAQLLVIMYTSGNIMPYWYDDAAGQYGISTGDYIKGISGNSSIINGVIATLGILFFYFRKQWGWLAVCLLTMVLCTTNLTLLCFLAALIVLIVFVKGKGMRLKALVLFISTVGLYWFVSPKNIVYIQDIFVRLFSVSPPGVPSELELYYAEHKDAFFEVKVRDSVYNNYQNEISWLKQLSGNDTTKRHSVLSSDAINTAINKWYGIPAANTPLNFVAGPGKLYGIKQTVFYVTHGSQNWPGGAGMGNYSSRLAVKATTLGIEGGYPEKYKYVSRDFFSHHLYNILYYYALPESEHSVMNMPNSVYDQLPGEYGLAGILLFLVFYLGYFWKHRREMSYGVYVLCLVTLFFGYEYWFEMITLTVFFELLMFMDIFARERTNGTPATHNSIDAGV